MSVSPQGPDLVLGYCPRCGNQLLEGELYCPRCGETVDASPPRVDDRTASFPVKGGYIGFWTRLMALVIDEIIMIVAAVLCLIVIVVVSSGQSFGVGDFLGMFLSFAILPAVLMGYWIVFTAIWGQTLGKMALGIKVVDREGRPPGLWKAFLREVVGKILSGLVICLGYIWVAFDREKRGWHDHIAGTYVVSARR